jgi:hypothetical protein
MRAASVFFCTFVAVFCAEAQGPAPAVATSSQPENARSGPLFRVTVVSRTTKAINYGHLTEPTKIGLKGTVLLPESEGEARVQSKRGAVEIDARVNRLEAPTRFGPEYLTYVLWAVTPEGRPVNLGELVPDPSNKARIKVSTDLQAFALIVTAEPYFSVMHPSDVVVMENVTRPDTAGKIEEIDAKYELLPRKQFTYNAGTRPAGAEGPKLSMDEYEAQLAVYQALNAIQIAKSAGADHYASGTLQKAEQLYQQAVVLQSQKSSSRQIVTAAREAAQTAEDARAISVKRHDEERSREERSRMAPPTP